MEIGVFLPSCVSMVTFNGLLTIGDALHVPPLFFSLSASNLNLIYNR